MSAVQVHVKTWNGGRHFGARVGFDYAGERRVREYRFDGTVGGQDCYVLTIARDRHSDPVFTGSVSCESASRAAFVQMVAAHIGQALVTCLAASLDEAGGNTATLASLAGAA